MPFTFGIRSAGQSKAGAREGAAFLRQLFGLRFGAAATFALVGASGIVPNLAAVSVLSEWGVPVVTASAIAIQAAVAWNFVGTELLVFRDRRAGGLSSRAARFWAVGNLDLLRLPFVALLIHGAGLGGVTANAVTLAAAFMVRYQLTSRLVYRRTGPAVDAAAGCTAPVVATSQPPPAQASAPFLTGATTL